MRHYLIENDRVKLMAAVKAGKTIDEIKAELARSGEGVNPKAVDDWFAGTPEVAEKLGKKPQAEKPEKPAKK